MYTFSKRLIVPLCIILNISGVSLWASPEKSKLQMTSNNSAIYHVQAVLNKYKIYLEKGTYEGRTWTSTQDYPSSRYSTLKNALNYFVEHQGKVVVETGTSRSFVSGGYAGCLQDDPKYWNPRNPAIWDWGAGIFTRVAAECLSITHAEIHTIDIIPAHIERCKIMTCEYKNILQYHVCSSIDYLARSNLIGKIDLLYLDAGDTSEECARLQLQEVMIAIQRGLLSTHAQILIDDVNIGEHNGQSTELGKAKYSIPFLLNHGFEIVENGYQVLLRKR